MISQLVERYRAKKVWARDRWYLTSRFLRKVLSHTMAVFLCQEADLWLLAETLTLEHDGQTLSRYAVEYQPGTEKLREVKRPRLFETAHQRSCPLQPRLFSLRNTEWLKKALKLDEYAPRRPRRPQALLQQVLFPYLDAL